MKKIPLINSKEAAIIDDSQFKKLSKYTWSLCTGYAVTSINGKSVSMHAMVVGKARQSKKINHFNRVRLDNRRKNLRVTTQSVCVQNAKKRVTNTSGYIGVSWHDHRGQWMAYCTKDYKQSTIGYFNTKIAAARAYNQRVLEIYGPRARVNDVYPLLPRGV